MEKLIRTSQALSNLESEYSRVGWDPNFVAQFKRCKDNLGTVTFEVKDELGDPPHERSESLALRDARAYLEVNSYRLKMGLENHGISYPGSRIATALEDYMKIVDRADSDISSLVQCWKLAGGI
ncbi:hypothetical protein DFQ26_000848 [Actinomortierella ambigua]|nr:hypothetical protein DFQ26_000848 [Actinomortierella ambigua]